MRYKSGLWTEEEERILKEVVESRTWENYDETKRYIRDHKLINRKPWGITAKISLMARAGQLSYKRNDGTDSYDEFLKNWKVVKKHEEWIQAELLGAKHVNLNQACLHIVERLNLKVSPNIMHIWINEQGWMFVANNERAKESYRKLQSSIMDKEAELAKRKLMEEYDGGKLIPKSKYKPKKVEGLYKVGDIVYIDDNKGVIIKEYPYFYLVDVGPYQTALNKV